MTTLTKEQESLFHKVRALLAKAESTPYEEEAATFLEKAQQLIAKYAIDEELLWANDPSKREQIVEEIVKIGDRDIGVHARRSLLHRIAMNNRCRTWYLTGGNTTIVCGFPNDAIFCTMLYSSIMVQMNFALANSLARDHNHGSSKVYRKEFMQGYIERVSERLAEHFKNQAEWLRQQASTGSTALVLRDRRAKVDEYVDQNKRLVSAPMHNYGKTNVAARAAGRVAGETADISGGRGGAVRQGRRELNS